MDNNQPNNQDDIDNNNNITENIIDNSNINNLIDLVFLRMMSDMGNIDTDDNISQTNEEKTNLDDIKEPNMFSQIFPPLLSFPGASTSLSSLFQNRSIRSNMNPSIPSFPLNTFSQYMEPPISAEIRQLSELEMKSWCKSEKISDEVIRVANKLWSKSKTGTFPTLDMFVNSLFNTLCMHASTISTEEKKKLVEHFLVNFGKMPGCMETESAIIFNSLHGHYPTEEELQTTMQRTMEFAMNPEEFHQKDKKYVPVANLSQLKPNKNLDEDTDCSLCFDTIEKGSSYYKLNPCGHIFHADSKSCLEGKSIMDWMNTHKTCPVCRTEIVVEIKK